MPVPGSDGDLVALGVISRAQGVRGQVRVKLYNPESDLLLSCRSLWVRRDGPASALTLREPPRLHQGDVLIWPTGCDDRDQAAALRGTEVCVPRSELPDLPPGEYYHRDLIGLRAELVDGTSVGTVVRIDPYPTIDVAVVRGGEGDTLDVPLLEPYWVRVDLERGCVVFDHLDHLRDLSKGSD